MSKKLLTILEGAATVVLGVLVAIFGGQEVMDIYFGVLFIVAGAGLLAFSIVGLVRTKVLAFPLLFASFAALLLGSFLLARYYSFGYFVYTLILLIIAAGGALVFYGVYTAVKFNVFYGVGQAVVGAAVATLGILYLSIPEFYKVFWIIVGVIVALYGIAIIVSAFLSNCEKSQK